MKHYGVIFLLILFFACGKKGKELKTENGFKYILYTQSTGQKAKVGDYLTIEMVYRNDKDSVLFDSRVKGIPIRFKLEKIPFKGSYEDGITNLAVNDSATFFVPADSLYNYYYKSRMETVPQNQTPFTAKSYLKFDIRLIKIQTDVQAEEEMVIREGDLEKKERVDISHYLDKHKITVSPESEGYYLIIRSKGKGPAIDSGRVVVVNYEGRFLNDSVFDGTRIAGRPYRFISGTHHVILGWELALKKLNEGDKFTLLLPSKLAYGSEGLHNPNDGSYLIPPMTPIVFDMEIISAEDAPAVSSGN